MAQRVVRNIENDYLMCSVCLGRYEDPRLLPCGHSFCKNCLSEHIRQTVQDRDTISFNCPIDRSQVPKPRGNLPPSEWANQYPPDSFTNNLIQAVRNHEGNGENPGGAGYNPGNAGYNPGNTGYNEPVHQQRNPTLQSQRFEQPLPIGIVCENHEGRPIEFFCLACNIIACSLCAVREHRGPNCECVTIDEAVERFRPRVEALRRRFQSQAQRVQAVGASEPEDNFELQNSKERALRLVDETECQVGQFYERTLQAIEDLKQQISESGRNRLFDDNQQMMMILANIEATREDFNEMCRTMPDIEFLRDLAQIEAKADEYDNAILTSSRNTSSVLVDFIQNPNFLQFVQNPPPIGSVSVSSSQNRGHFAGFNSNVSNTNRAQRRPVTNINRPTRVARQMQSPVIRPTRTPRPVRQTALRQQQKSHEVINIKDHGEDTISWQLTGVVFVDNSVIVIDSENEMVRKRGIAGSGGNDTLPLQQPLCISNMGSTSNVAVTQPEKKQISVVGTSGPLSVIEVIKTNKPYEGICQMADSKFVVSCMAGRISVDIISRNGRVLKSIERSHLFQWPRFLTVSTNGNIIVSDRDQKHVISLSQSGQVVWTYSTAFSPWGVTSDKNGKIYLCLDNNTVQIISDEGRLLQDKFVNIKEGIKTPYSIAARSRQVAVTEYGSSLFAANSPNVHIFSF